MHDATADYVRYLQGLEVTAFEERARAFWDTPPATNEEVFGRFLDVVTVRGRDEQGDLAAYWITTLTYPIRQTMWRVRRVRRDGPGPTIPNMNSETDLWEAPAHVVRARGRLNDVRESILYVSVGDAAIAMVEARVPAGEQFALIKYETTRAVTLTSIASDTPPEGIPAELLELHNAVTAFYRDVFAREFDGQNELSYVLSNRVAKDWFDLPDAAVDGWSFPSVAHKRGVNAAFRPARAHEVLRVVGIAYCTAVDSALLGRRIQATEFSPGPEAGERDFRWHPMRSPVQLATFPEFR